MKHALLRRALAGWVLLLLYLAPLALRPTATWSAATSSETSDRGAAESSQKAVGTWFGWETLGKPSGALSLDHVTVARNQNGSLVIAAVAPYGDLWWNYERSAVFLPFLRK